MKKIFKITSYDFRRLMLNPITLIVMAVALVALLILGATYKIPTTPEYSASTSGETTQQVYNNFISNNKNLDTNNSLRALILDAENRLEMQKKRTDYTNFKDMCLSFKSIQDEIEKYKYGPENSIYIEKNDVSEIKLAASQLQNFVKTQEGLEVFENNLFFSEKDFATLQNCANFFTNAVNLPTVKEVLDKLKDNFANFQIIIDFPNNNTHTWEIDSTKLEAISQTYIQAAKTKLEKISAEMRRLNEVDGPVGISHLEDMKSLITNFKLTCQSAKEGTILQLYLLLQNHMSFDKHFKSIKNMYKYQPIVKEETLATLSIINRFLADESEYYSAHQVPLNFNTASSQVTFCDNTYFLMAIVGFFTILFGIFCAFKQFGLDRKNGKMDVVLSQDVTFGQVFAGKFLAIVFSTLYVLGVYLAFTLVWSLLFHPAMAGEILAVFNLSSAYTIHPLVFLLIKVLGIELQVIFWVIITIFLMNLSRKFEIMFSISIALFAVATICNLFLNGVLAYCLFPFVHADLTAFLGGGKMHPAFLQTALYSSGNFFISLAYYTVVVVLLYFFTKQLFKKN